MTETAELLARRYTLALNVFREGRGEPLIGKLYIAQVTENRVRDSRWPDTYVSVITQRLQFSAFNRNDPNITVFPDELSPVWADCVAAGDFVIAAPAVLTRANHYHAVGVRPPWADDSKIVARQGSHIFYEL